MWKTERGRSALMLTAMAMLSCSNIGWAGVSFNAVTESSASGINPMFLIPGEVQGFVEDGRGRVKFISSEGGRVPDGSAVVTADGGLTSWFFDPRKKTCLKWSGQFAGRPVAEGLKVKNLEVKRLSEERGAKVAGLETTHHSFEIRFDSTAANGSAWSTRVLEELWVTDAIEQPTLQFWLEAAPGANVDQDSLKILSEKMAVTGTVLKRTKKVTIVAEDGRTLESAAGLEVTRIGSAEVTAADLEVPAACRQSVRGRNQ